MQTSYIYSVSRANTLSESLLNKTDVERLLVAEPGEDLHSALKETYLASYISQALNEDMSVAIEQTLIEAKKIINLIAPEASLFKVLWIQYDIHNLRVFSKAKAKGLSFDDCKPFLSERGVYEPEHLFNATENENLDFLQSGWQAGYDKSLQAVAAGDLNLVDGILDKLYYDTSLAIAKAYKDTFINNFLKLQIDINNLKGKLRFLKNDSIDFQPKFIEGGSINMNQIESEEDVYSALHNLGGSDFWKEAIEYYQSSGNTTSLDARFEEYMIIFTKEASHDMFSSSSLVLYYLKCKQAAANVRMIVVGKNSNMNQSAIRSNLKMAYVND